MSRHWDSNLTSPGRVMIEVAIICGIIGLIALGIWWQFFYTPSPNCVDTTGRPGLQCPEWNDSIPPKQEL